MFGLQRLVAASACRLAFERVELLGHFLQDVVDAQQVLLGRLQLGFRQPPLGFVFGYASGFFQQDAPVRRARGEDAFDAALLDDGVGLRPQPCPHEQLLDVTQAAVLPVQIVLAGAVPVEAPGHNHFTGQQLQVQAVGAFLFGGL